MRFVPLTLAANSYIHLIKSDLCNEIWVNRSDRYQIYLVKIIFLFSNHQKEILFSANFFQLYACKFQSL